MIRKYTKKDKSSVIALIIENTPKYFDETEIKDFDTYLENELEDYFVYEENSKIIGAGGINYFLEERLARISWDMIDPNAQGHGIGKKLVEYRIKHLNKNPLVDSIIVRTSQLVYKFYEKMGFELENIEKDFWAENYDLYQMHLPNKTQAKRI